MLKATCPSHPAHAAVAICGRCGKFVCGDCLELAGEVSLCLECHGRGKDGPPSRRATASLVVGTIGLILGILPGLFVALQERSGFGVKPPFLALTLGLLPGMAGFFLGAHELAAIDRGESPSSGAGRARVGRLLGRLTVGLLLATFVVSFVLTVRGMRGR